MEKRIEIKRSTLYSQILNIIKKLELKECDKDHYDHISIAVELENFILNQNKWIKIKERLPEPNTGETFIVFINKGSIQTSWFSQDEDFLNPEFDYSDVTHWMPLPDEPK